MLGRSRLLVAPVALAALALGSAPGGAGAATFSEVTTITGYIVDATPDRVLYRPTNADGPLKVHLVAGGADATVPNPDGREVGGLSGMLFADGVLFGTYLVGGSVTSAELEEWHTGAATTTSLGPGPGTAALAGNYFSWSSGDTLTRRDLTTGTNVAVATDVYSSDVAANGDVVYGKQSGQSGVYRWRGGVTTKLSNAPSADSSNYPVTDGTNTVYRRHRSAPCCVPGPTTLLFSDGTTETALPDSDAGTGDQSLPRRDYAARGGWIAYTRASQTEVWTRDPAGNLGQASQDGDSSLPHVTMLGLSPAGQVLYNRKFGTFLGTAGWHPFPLGTYEGSGFWQDDRWYLIHPPGTLARLDTDTAITQGPPAFTQATSVQFEIASTAAAPAFDCTLDGSPVACSSGDYTNPSLNEGTHTFTAGSTDPALTETDPTPASVTWTVDHTPPSPFALNEPADGSATNSAELSWTAADDSGGSGVVSYAVTVDGQLAGTTHQATVFTPIAGVPEGSQHTWSVEATDAAGNSRVSETRSFTLDTTAPTAPTPVSPAGGDVVSDPRPTLRWSPSTDGGSGLAGYDVELDATTTRVGRDATSFEPTADLTEGLHSWRVTAVDAAGNFTAGESATFRVYMHQPEPGLPGVSINDGARFTNDPDVTLTLRWPLFATSVLVSNDGGFDTPGSPLLAAHVPWRLESSGPDRFPKTVYVRFGASVGNETYQDDIILDETRPRIRSATVKVRGRARAAAAPRRYSIRLNAVDNGSGLARVQWASTRARPATARAFRTTLSVSSRKAPRWIRVSDRAGNRSPWRRLKLRR